MDWKMWFEDKSINKGVFMDSRKGLSDRSIKPGHFMDLF